MKKLLAILFLSVSFCINSVAYTEKDSLEIKAIYESGWEIEPTNADSALVIYTNAKQKSLQLNYTSGVAMYYANASAAWNTKGDYKKGLAINQEGLVYCLQVKNTKATAKSYSNIANSFQYLSMYDSAASYYIKSAKILEQLKDSNSLTIIYSNLTGLFSNLYRPSECIEYGNKALALHNKGFWPRGLSNTYSSLGNGYTQVKDYANAEDCFNHSIAIAETQGNIYNLCVAYGSLQEMLRSQKKYKQMLVAAEKCAYYTKQVNYKILEAIAYNALANALYFNSNYKAAIEAGLKGFEIAKEQGIEDEMRKISAVLTYSYAALHDVENSQKYALLQNSIQEHILNEKVYSSVEVVESKLNEEKLQSANALQQQQLQQRKFLIIILLLILLFLITVAIAFYAISKRSAAVLEAQSALQQQQIQTLEQQRKLEATNAIIKGEEQERSRIAKDLHDGLGGMLSSVKYSLINFRESASITPESSTSFQHGLGLLDDSISELRRVAHNMLPESLLRFGLDAALRDFCTHINTSGAISVHYESFDVSNYKANSTVDISVFRMAQELINNALKHARAKQIIVQLSFKPDRMILLV